MSRQEYDPKGPLKTIVSTYRAERYQDAAVLISEVKFKVTAKPGEVINTGVNGLNQRKLPDDRIQVEYSFLDPDTRAKFWQAVNQPSTSSTNES